MCGIVGIIKKRQRAIDNNDISLFKDMLICDSVRGDDSVGAFTVDDDFNAHFVKTAGTPFNLIRSNEFTEFSRKAFQDGQLLIGHNRKATEGTVIADNAHPFQSGPIILVHNGHISNFRTLVPIKIRDKYKIDVDSHGIAYLLSTNDPEKIIPKMHGVYTIVWYNALTKSLNIVRNEQRPLYMTESEDAFYLASEGGLLRWLLARHGVKLVNNAVVSLLPEKINSVNLDKDKFEWNKIIELESNTSNIDKEFEKDGWVKSSSGVWTRKSTTHSKPKDSSFASFTDAHKADIPSTSKPTTITIPEDAEWSIHYGHDRWVDEDVPYQRIVWSCDDYKELPGSGNKRWQIWGKALESEKIEVVGTFSGTEKEVEELVYASHLIGVVRRTKFKYLSPSSDADPHSMDKVQEVIVLNSIPVKLHKTSNNAYVTVEHYEHLMQKGICSCEQAYCNMVDADEAGPELTYSPISNDVIITCGWCAEANRKVENAVANSSI